MDDEQFEYSSDDSVNEPEWHPEGIHLWDCNVAYDHIRDFRIAHNTTTVYEPCSSCGALYYRGPFHIVLKHRGILCHECSDRSLAPVTLVITRFKAQWHEHLITFDKSPKESTRLIIGTRSEQIPKPTLSFIEKFHSFAETDHILTVHGLEGPNRFMIYAAQRSDDMQESTLQPEKTTPLAELFSRFQSALLGVGYLFFQYVNTKDPAAPLLLRTHEEWRSL